MPSTMTLNTRVHIVSKSGKKETITARELIARGTGSSFEAFQMLDEYEMLAEAYKAEMSFEASEKAREKDRKDHLPFGAHLLPQDYQDFLYSWNKTIANTPGCRWWNGLGRDIYKINHKAAWKQWVAKNKEFRARYAAEVEQLIAYQATHSVEDSEDEDDDEQDQQLPSLPPSPISEQPDTEYELESQLDAPQSIPQVFPDAQGVTEQPDTGAEDGNDAEDATHKAHTRLHNPIYTNRLWQSPIAKLFVQHMRGRTWTFEVRVRWRNAGNTEFKLTHDNCMRYLAYNMGRITVSKLMEMEPRAVHAKLFGPHRGVPGFYTKPKYY